MRDRANARLPRTPYVFDQVTRSMAAEVRCHLSIELLVPRVYGLRKLTIPIRSTGQDEPAGGTRCCTETAGGKLRHRRVSSQETLDSARFRSFCHLGNSP